ncbi:MAG: polymer-forming cytoskeletal protein [Sandaracinaceae bacterium]
MNSRRADGIIGSELVVHGKLGGKSDLRIDGVFEGEVALEGALTIGPDASVVGPVSVGELTLEGEIRGDVVATDGVAIRPGGRLLGDVRARRIGIEDGGSLQGGIEMDFDVPADLAGGGPA